MGKTIVITGASDGIGAAAAAQLAASGHQVVVVGRSPAKTKQVAEAIDAEYFVADFTELAQVRALAAELLASYPRIDVLANNAGGQMGSVRTLTADGYEKAFQVNHLAPFLLTTLMIERLIESRASVVNTSSMASRMGRFDLDDLNSERSYSAFKAYGAAKLENVMFTKELHRRYHDQGISTLAFHPGVVASNFASEATNFMGLAYRTGLRNLMTTSQTAGGYLSFFAEGTPGVEWFSGEYYDKTAAAKPAAAAMNPALTSALWERSQELVKAS